MAKDDAIGMQPDGEIEQYPKGTLIPSKPIKVIDEDGSVSYQELNGHDHGLGESDPFLEDDSDLDLDDEDDE